MMRRMDGKEDKYDEYENDHEHGDEHHDEHQDDNIGNGDLQTSNSNTSTSSKQQPTRSKQQSALSIFYRSLLTDEGWATGASPLDNPPPPFRVQHACKIKAKIPADIFNHVLESDNRPPAARLSTRLA